MFVGTRMDVDEPGELLRGVYIPLQSRIWDSGAVGNPQLERSQHVERVRALEKPG